MTQIYVDADACPVKDEVLRVAARHKLHVFMVTNQWLRLTDDPLVELVQVPDGPDVADDWIAERAGAGDIVITSDIPLAARALERGAQALGPTGRPFTDNGIGMALAMRELSAHLRDTGEIRGGGPAFAKKDRSNFLQALDQAVQTALRTG
tara:strand:- start:1174 stop:1626 length:453 start_codon:yes stop_codon:yes gene_type:complete